MVGTVDASAMQGGMSGAGSGMAAGAAIGTMIAPGVGTAIGALIGGAVGGIAGGLGGALGGRKAKKAKRYMRKAQAIQKQREREAYKQNLLSQVRNARIERASSLAAIVAAGTEEGSGAQGAMSSYGSQTANIVEYLSVDRARAEKAAYYMARAGKNMSTAKAITQTTQGLISLTGSIAEAATMAYTGGNPQNQPEYSFGSNGELTISQGPYLDSNGKVQYVKQGQTPITLK